MCVCVPAHERGACFNRCVDGCLCYAASQLVTPRLCKTLYPFHLLLMLPGVLSSCHRKYLTKGLACGTSVQARAEERHSAEKRRAEALAAQLATHQSDSAPGGNSPATQSPAKTPWRVSTPHVISRVQQMPRPEGLFAASGPRHGWVPQIEELLGVRAGQGSFGLGWAGCCADKWQRWWCRGGWGGVPPMATHRQRIPRTIVRPLMRCDTSHARDTDVPPAAEPVYVLC